MSRASVSVIVPSYNCARFIGEAIDSILQQTQPPEQIIIVDDGSTDDTEQVVRRYSDDRIDAVVDATAQLPAKVAAMRAHATQVTVADHGGAFALSNNLALPILGEEHYVLVSGNAGERDQRGWETDLLAGLNLQ